MARTYAEIAALIVARVPRRNPLVGGIVTADLGLQNGTQMVSVLTGGATRTAAYLAPIALQVPGNVWVTRAGPALDAPLLVPLSNYQVPVTGWDTAWGAGGTGAGDTRWGSGPGTWGS